MSAPTTPLSQAKDPTFDIARLPLEQISPDPQQPRQHFDEAGLQELAESIKAQGLINPIVVKPNGKGFYIVDGERRYRAAKLAGLKEVAVVTRADLKDQDVSTLQLVANIQRADLTLAEQCAAVAKLVKQVGTARAAAARLGKSEAWVSKRAGIAEAPAPVKNLVDNGKIADPEIAAGLTQLIQVGDKRSIEQTLAQAKAGPEARHPLTRDGIRQQVQIAKDTKKYRAEAAKAAAKSRKNGSAEKERNRQADERTKRAKRVEQWNGIKPLLDKFVDAARKGLGFDIRAPWWSEYNGEAPPATVGGAKFDVNIDGSAEYLQKLHAKTGLGQRVGIYDFPPVTPDQARKIEQVLGKSMKWRCGGDLTGQQLANLAVKLGQKLDIPLPAKAAPPAQPAPAKAAPKPAAPASKKTKRAR